MPWVAMPWSTAPGPMGRAPLFLADLLPAQLRYHFSGVRLLPGSDEVPRACLEIHQEEEK